MIIKQRKTISTKLLIAWSGQDYVKRFVFGPIRKNRIWIFYTHKSDKQMVYTLLPERKTHINNNKLFNKRGFSNISENYHDTSC